VKKSIKDWLIVLASLADEVFAALLILLVLWWLKIPLTWPVFLLISLFFVVSVFIIHRLVIPAYHQRIATGQEALIGLEGTVVESLNLKGLIKVKGEYWKAESLEGTIESGSKIEIIGSQGLVLKVKRLDSHRI
jgi:membrane-bound ClpP family serine protease